MRSLSSQIKARFAVVALATTSIACSVEVDETTDAETGSTHGLVSIQRSAVIGSEEAPTADAIAHFAQIPSSGDASELLSVVGLAPRLPDIGQCNQGQSLPGDPSGELTLLDVGEITIATDAASTRLAPMAFPPVRDMVSGVVYTTRDRASLPFPAGSVYQIKALGSDQLPAFDLRADAPDLLADVTVGGVALEEIESVSLGEPIDLTWSVGALGDIVYVELLSDQDGDVSVVCAFQDDAGAGSLDATLLSTSGEGWLSLHRVRSHEVGTEGLDIAELRFDFELAAAVRFAE